VRSRWRSVEARPPDRAGRSRRRWVTPAPPPATAQGTRDLPARPLRGRLRRDGQRHPRPRRRLAPGGGTRGRWAFACRREDEGLPHRRGVRLPRVPHPAADPAKRRELVVYTCPSKKALASIKDKVRTVTRGATNQPLAVLCFRLAPVLRCWTNYFRHGVSKSTFDYVREFTWRR
jgi:Group II intron, maturase-specific domain